MAEKNKKQTTQNLKLKRVSFKEFMTDPSNNRGRAMDIGAMELLQDSLVARGWGLPLRLAILATAALEMGKDGAASRGIGGNGYLGYSEERMPLEYVGNDPLTRAKLIHYIFEDLTHRNQNNWLAGDNKEPHISSGREGFELFWNNPNVWNATMIFNKSNIRPAGGWAERVARAKIAKIMLSYMK